MVDRATWEPGGLLDAWVFNRRDGEWIGRVRNADGTINWLRSSELRIHQAPTGVMANPQLARRSATGSTVNSRAMVSG